MKSTVKESIYEGLSQFLQSDPANIRLLEDRVLIRDLGEQERVGSIIIPETAAARGVGKAGMLRLGVVVAVGPGDKFKELGLDESGAVRRKLLTERCPECETGRFFDAKAYEYVPCPKCGGTTRAPAVMPTECKPGDRVIYDRRREAELLWKGETYSLIHEEQSILAVLEGE